MNKRTNITEAHLPAQLSRRADYWVTMLPDNNIIAELLTVMTTDGAMSVMSIMSAPGQLLVFSKLDIDVQRHIRRLHTPC